MSRHRDVRKLDYDEEYEEAWDDAVYGRSADDHDYGLSPSAEEYLYSRSKDNVGLGAYLPTSEDIQEEGAEDGDGMSSSQSTRRSRFDSVSYQKPSLSATDEARLQSVLDELRNVMGDQVSEGEMTHTVLANNFDLERSVDALLNRVSGLAAGVQSPTHSTMSTRRMPEAWGSSNGATNPRRPLQLRHTADTNTALVNKPNRLLPEANGAIGSEESGAISKEAIPQRVQDLDLQDDELVINASEDAGATANGDDEKSASVTRDKEATSLPKTPARQHERPVDVEARWNALRQQNRDLLNLVVVGHVDAGKSTMMGHLLYLQGTVGKRTMHKYEQESKKIGKQSFMYAWVLDDTEEERSRGITVDVAQRVFETGTKTVTLLDAPGHRDFIPNMITGAARADVAVMVVDAATGAFEAGFESGGQTREHAILVRSLGLAQLAVAVNKLDTVGWSESRFTEVRDSMRQFLKTAGFRDSDVTYIPCSGLTGENLTLPPTETALSSWYSGPTLLQAIDQLKVPERGINRPTRLCISDIYKGQGSNMCVAGKLETGYVQTGDRLLLMPQGEAILVKGVQVEGSEGGCAFAGDHVTIVISGVDSGVLHVGDFLCDPAAPIPQVTRIQARIVIFAIGVPLVKGSQVDFYYQSVSEPAQIRRLVSQLNKTTGEIVKQRPRALVRNTSAVIELEFSHPICIELYRNFKELGRFMLRSGGRTIAAGLVTELVS